MSNNIMLTIDKNIDDADWDILYPSGGMPPQPCHVLIPEEPPTITTERLYLRPLKADDAEGILALWRTQPPNPLLGGKIPTIDTFHEWLGRKRFTGPPSAAGRGFWFVIIRRDDSTGRIIGHTGFNQLVPLPNIGYGVASDVWGNGYATEAVRGLLDAWWALPREEGSAQEKEIIVANAAKHNLASMRILEKFGFKIYQEHEYKDGTLLCCLFLERSLSNEGELRN
ncbi:hypothetical protein FQN50_008396 [Emmonsiellopsis sp. PD_5]|nr:hypothetical protein FQN50_008396 [Emmonsiellopsis sp. PD_5]